MTTPAVDPNVAAAILALAGGTDNTPSSATQNLIGPDGKVHTYQFNRDTGKYDIDLGLAPTTQNVPSITVNTPPPAEPQTTTSPLSRQEIEAAAQAAGGTLVDRGGILVVTWPDGSSTRYDPSRTSREGQIGYNPTYYPAPSQSTSGRTISLSGATGRAVPNPSGATNQVGAPGGPAESANVGVNDLVANIILSHGAGVGSLAGGQTSGGLNYSPEQLASDLARHNESQYAQTLAAFRIAATGDPVKDAANLGAVQTQVGKLMDAGMTQAEAITAIQQAVMNKPPVDEFGNPQSNETQTYHPGVGLSPGYVSSKNPRGSGVTEGTQLFARCGGLRLCEPILGIRMNALRQGVIDPAFMAAEAGRQENMRPVQGGLRFTPTNTPTATQPILRLPSPSPNQTITPAPEEKMPMIIGSPGSTDITHPILQLPAPTGMITPQFNEPQYQISRYADGGTFSFNQLDPNYTFVSPYGDTNYNDAGTFNGGSITVPGQPPIAPEPSPYIQPAPTPPPPSSSPPPPQVGPGYLVPPSEPAPPVILGGATSPPPSTQTPTESAQQILDQAARARAMANYDYRLGAAGLLGPVTVTLPNSLNPANQETGPGTNPVALPRIPAGVRVFYREPQATQAAGGLQTGTGNANDLLSQAQTLGLSLNQLLAQQERQNPRLPSLYRSPYINMSSFGGIGGLLG